MTPPLSSGNSRKKGKKRTALQAVLQVPRRNHNASIQADSKNVEAAHGNNGYTDVYPCYAPSMAGKSAGLRIRIEKDLREAFQAACHAENRPASDVLREFMRSFADRRSNGKQANLFAAASSRISVPK